MKVFLLGFSTPTLKEVVLKLKERGIEIIYWQGGRVYFKEVIQRDRVNFLKTIFHFEADAVRNIAPRELDCSNFEPIGEDLIKKMCEYESTSFVMLNRVDYFNSTFTRKRNYYYQYIKFWNGMLKKFQPEAILFSSTPHSITWHVVYALAKIFGIKTVILDNLTIGRSILVNDYKKSPKYLLKDLEQNREKTINDLSFDIKDYYLKQTDEKVDSTPTYKKKHLSGRAPLRLPRLKSIVKNIAHLTFLKTTRAFLKMYFTNMNFSHLDENLSGIKFKLLANKWRRENKKNIREYLKLQVEPDFSKKFIYIPLHFQPEGNTYLEGGVFDDQILMIDMLASSMPDDWIIYVKENVAQWSPNLTRTDLYRYKGYYKKMAGLRNTCLISPKISSYDLIKHCRAIATVTGTAGWEAILRGKPALVFGYAWYEYCQGAFRVSDFNSCKNAINKILGGYKPDSQKIINFLAALDKNSIKAKNYKTLFEKKDENSLRENTVKNLSEAFYNEIIQ